MNVYVHKKTRIHDLRRELDFCYDLLRISARFLSDLIRDHMLHLSGREAGNIISFEYMTYN